MNFQQGAAPNLLNLAAQHGFPPYNQMVTNLFKKLPSPQEEMIHATVGMCGEIGELLTADSGSNILEELGDFEFYWEAFRQKLQAGYEGIYNVEDPKGRDRNITLGNVFYNLTSLSAEALDYTKKPWIYRDRDPKYLEMLSTMGCIRINFDKLIGFLGFSLEEVRFANQVKLLGTTEMKGRYASGVYSDEQAIARADKT